MTERASPDDPKLERLYLLLDKAEQLAGEFSGGFSNHFLSAEEFHASLTRRSSKLESGDLEQINDLWLWFAPTGDWDDFIGQDGNDLANELFALLTDLKEFYST